MTGAATAPSTALGQGGGEKAELLAQLTDGVLALTSSESWAEWLRVSRRFHHYSFSNQVLILRQRPDATWVAGYRNWLKLGRQVRQGEQGIRILAPCLSRSSAGEDEGQPAPILLGFRLARVFDIAQTEGEELRQPVRTILGEAPQAGLESLGARAAELGFRVELAELGPSRNGDCSHALRRIRLREGLPAAHRLKTLAHELAHVVLHGPAFAGSRALSELEAESVAFLVCREFGVDSSQYSFGYLATWSGGGPEAVRLVSQTAGRILRGLEQVLGPTAEGAG